MFNTEKDIRVRTASILAFAIYLVAGVFGAYLAITSANSLIMSIVTNHRFATTEPEGGCILAGFAEFIAVMILSEIVQFSLFAGFERLLNEGR
jgi:hypothetical protein